MKQAGEMAQAALQTGQRPDSKRRQPIGEKDDRRVRHLWVRMLGIFGSKWASQYGTGAGKGEDLTLTQAMWARGLQKISDDQIAHAIEYCLDWPNRWPPDLPEFRRLCRAHLPKPSDQDSLPDPSRVRATEEQSREALDEIYGMIGARPKRRDR